MAGGVFDILQVESVGLIQRIFNTQAQHIEQGSRHRAYQQKTQQPPPETPQALPQTPQEGTVVEDKIDTVATKAFAVQLGSFSTEEAAKQRVSELSAQGIEASVQIRDGVWKVVSSRYSTKEEARAAAAKWRDIVGDAFVVAI